MMGLLPNTAGPFDSDVEKVTPEEDKGSEDWGSILDICDRVGDSSANAKECLKSIIRRLNHQSPHVVLKAITLLDACVKNCKKAFHLEVASRDFVVEYRKLLKKYQSTQPRLAENLKLSLMKWAENEFKNDPEIRLIPDLFSKLRQEGVDFSNSESTSKNMNALPKNPDAATSQKEIDDIAKAIEMSLKETSTSGSNSLYPTSSSMNSGSGYKTNPSSNPTKPKLIVKALYDFEADEDNELTFYTGETIEVLDNSDENWWKGANRRGEGLFPANFVTTDLSASPRPSVESSKNGSIEKNKSRVRLNDALNGNDVKVIINEQKIDRLLHLLHEANPTDDREDTDEMLNLEDEVNAMGPLIDSELEKVDRKHAQLTQLSSNLVDALNLYHSLMREPYGTSQPLPVIGIPVHSLAHPQPIMYNNSMNGPAPYSMTPTTKIMNEQYHPGPLPQPPVPLDMNHQMGSHHFVPIVSVPMQPDNFRPQEIMANPSAQNYQNMNPTMMPLHYAGATTYPVQQVLQSFYQPGTQEPLSPGSNALQNGNRM